MHQSSQYQGVTGVSVLQCSAKDPPWSLKLMLRSDAEMWGLKWCRAGAGVAGIVRIGTTKKMDKEDGSRGVNKINLSYFWSAFPSRS